MIEFTIPGNPPRTTAQQNKIAVVNGTPLVYSPKKLKDAKELYYTAALIHRPKEPMQGAIGLSAEFHFGTPRKRLWGTPKITRPDTDNMIKALKDALTKADYWGDDAQITKEYCAKYWCRPEDARVVVIVYEIPEEEENVQS